MFKKIEPVFVRENPLGEKGIQRIYKFDNGYGASAVRLYYEGEYLTITNNERQWELAVLKFNKNDKAEEGKFSGKLVYDTPLTTDVIGYLNERKLQKVLRKIKRLKETTK